MKIASIAFVSALIIPFFSADAGEPDCSYPLAEQGIVGATAELDKPSDFIFSSSQDRSHLYFAGDVLAIDPDNFPFFFPPDNLAVANVKSVTFEARKIIVT